MSDAHGPEHDIKGSLKSATSKLKLNESHHESSKKPVNQFTTGMITSANKQIFGQMTRGDYLNEYIELWREDYVAKLRCVCFVAVAVISWNAFTPFSLFCVALAAKYWNWAIWNRNIPRFNGLFRNIVLLQ